MYTVMNDGTEKMKTVVICGPTGIGKTSVAIDLSRAFHGEIVNADSMQIYKYMDIGSAKPTAEEQALAHHHLIDIVEPDEPFDAAIFAQRAMDTVRQLHDSDLFPFVAGGTGLYIKALIHGLFRDRPCNPDTLARLNREAKRTGPQALHERLKVCDPLAAEKIHPNDTFRIVRALEVFFETGIPISSCHEQHGFPEPRLNALKIGLTMDREALYDRINKRVDQMLDAGLVKEVESLMDRGYSPYLKPMRSIGYRHVALYLTHEMGWEDMVALFKRDTRRYAKRQLTWFRNDPDMLWFHPSEIHRIENVVDQFIKA